MAEGGYAITVDARPVVRMLGSASAELHDVLLAQLQEMSGLAKEEMRSRVDVGVGGESGLKGSVSYVLIPSILTSEVKPTLPYGDALETGSRPHWVSAKPGSPLAQWAALKGINPYALQRSIATKGTMPHPYIKPTYEAIMPTASERFAAVIADFVVRHNNGV